MNGGCDLIETLWNVKTGITQQVEDMMRDLIETLWNVKVASTQISISGHSI